MQIIFFYDKGVSLFRARGPCWFFVGEAMERPAITNKCQASYAVNKYSESNDLLRDGSIIPKALMPGRIVSG